jgi:hypothetical protein
LITFAAAGVDYGRSHPYGSARAANSTSKTAASAVFAGHLRDKPISGGNLPFTVHGRVPFFVSRVSERIEPANAQLRCRHSRRGNAGMNITVPTGEAGVRVAMIDSDLLGGTCPNRGCMPKKALVAEAHALDQIERAKTHHITVGKPSVDWPALIGREKAMSAASPDAHCRPK